MGPGELRRASAAQRLEESAGESEDIQTRVFHGFLSIGKTNAIGI